MWYGGIKQKIKKKYKTEKQKKMKKPLEGFFYFASDKDNFVSDFHTFLI